MINKLYLQSIVSKYHLKGFIESVKWDIKDKNLNINFISPTRDMIGSISAPDINLPDATVAIYQTSTLTRLLNITTGDLLLDLIKENRTYTKMTISDKQFNLVYSLADISIIPQVPGIDEPKEYHVEIDLVLNDNHINPLIKSKEALGDINNIFINSSVDFNGDKEIEFLFGEKDKHSNKISYFIPPSNIKFNSQDNFSLCFDSNVFKEILNANKESSLAKMYLYFDGLLKLEFLSEGIKSTYFLVKKEEF